MASIQNVQLGSHNCQFTKLFSAFQTLSGTTYTALPTGLAVPVHTEASNPIGLIDNRVRRMTTLLLGFAMTTANNVKAAVAITGFSRLGVSSIYLPTRFFLGEAQAGNYDVSTPMGEATSFLADNFSLKTYASPYVNYIEPTADSSMALLLVDMRGADYVTVQLAAGAATAATKAQVFYGMN